MLSLVSDVSISVGRVKCQVSNLTGPKHSLIIGFKRPVGQGHLGPLKLWHLGIFQNSSQDLLLASCDLNCL